MKKIHINAGHGGKDPGAVGNGLREKDITLKVALKLGEQLRSCGFIVSFTRINDAYVPLLEIARRANHEKADLFISIHCNAAANAAASGLETLVYSINGENEKAARLVQGDLVRTTGMKDRGLKARPDLAVLNSTEMTAMLVELGFVSNRQDAQMLEQDSFLDVCAKSMCRSICTYYGLHTQDANPETPTQTIPQWQKDGLTALVDLGIIGDKAYWEKRMMASITVGEALGLLGKGLQRAK